MEYTLLDYKTSFYRIFTHGLEASEAVEDELALVLCGEPAPVGGGDDHHLACSSPFGASVLSCFRLHCERHLFVLASLTDVYFGPDVTLCLTNEGRVHVPYHSLLVFVSFGERAPGTHSAGFRHGIKRVFIGLGSEGDLTFKS